MIASGSEKSSFGAVVDGRTRVVVFGSLPGEVSLAKRQYYAKPTNQFWRLIGGVIGVDLKAIEDYDERVERLLASGVGLWDVIGAAHREGSLDSSIRGHRPNDLVEFRSAKPNVRAFAFNGGKAFAVARKQFVRDDKFLVPLPSSSAAYCAMSFERKLSEWKRLQAYLDQTL